LSERSNSMSASDGLLIPRGISKRISRDDKTLP
jgi:hypothetical protein